MEVVRVVNNGVVRRFHHALTRSACCGRVAVHAVRRQQLDPVSGVAESVPDLVAHSHLETRNDPGSLRPLGRPSVEPEALTVTSSYLPQPCPEGPVCCGCRHPHEGRHD